jgi:hypothetical protein
MHDDRTIPRGTQDIESVLHEELHRMRTKYGIGQVAQRQQATVGIRFEQMCFEKLRSHGTPCSSVQGAAQAADESEPPDRLRRSGLREVLEGNGETQLRTIATPDAWNRPGPVNRKANPCVRERDMARM